MSNDHWATLADAFVEGAYATVKGRVRTYVLHEQLLRHLPAPPATVLDVGGGAANQSLPLARLGYKVTVLDPSAAMLMPLSRVPRGCLLKFPTLGGGEGSGLGAWVHRFAECVVAGVVAA